MHGTSDDHSSNLNQLSRQFEQPKALHLAPMGFTQRLLPTPEKKEEAFLIQRCVHHQVLCRPFLRMGITERTVWTMRERRGSLVVVRGFGFNGGGGGGGWDKSGNTRVLGNLALAIGLTYLTMTGQLGWILDAIVSIWLLAVLLPIVGLGAFFWFAGRDIVQSSCPSCGNNFQIFKSFLKDGEQLCPYCSQPFTVQGDKFVKGSADRFTTSGPIFGGSSSLYEKQKVSSATVVDVEAEVKDVD